MCPQDLGACECGVLSEHQHHYCTARKQNAGGNSFANIACKLGRERRQEAHCEFEVMRGKRIPDQPGLQSKTLNK